MGIKALKFFCNKYPELLPSRFTVDFIVEGMSIILDDNLCHFDNKFYTQISGTFTGTTVAPTYATLAMAYLESILFEKLNEVYSPGIVEYIVNNWKRFLDDGFIAWNKKFGDVQVFIDMLNSLDENIEFTHEISDSQISYLNVLVYKGTNSLMCDIFHKETDTKEYLPFSSCHVHHIKINIPYNLCRSVCTIVEDINILQKRLDDLKHHLRKCKYPMKVVNSAICKAKSIDQADLRTKKDKKTDDGLVFISTYNPKNPNVNYIINNAMFTLKSHPILNEIFGDVKLIKSKREPPSLEDTLTRSNFKCEKPVFGVKQCHKKGCKTCPLIYETDKYNFWEVGYDFNIRGTFDCTIKDCIYALTCKGCCKYYIGKTVNLRHRMTKHRSDINYVENRNQYVHKHIYLCGGGQFYVTPFYSVKSQGEVAHCAIEDYFIRKFKPALNTRF